MSRNDSELCCVREDERVNFGMYHLDCNYHQQCEFPVGIPGDSDMGLTKHSGF